jgi:uncharacterized protein (DUF736 family)
MDYDNTNRGALFKNDRKETDKHPDYKGTINVAEDDYWLSAWLKKDKNGKTYMSLSVQPKQASQSEPAEKPAAAEFDDEIPF